MAITIYKLDASPPARAAIMVAELLKLNYKTVDVNVLAGENHKPEYLQKNPLHTVPLLEDGDFFLADSHAIVTYLVSKYGADRRADLYPNDLRTRAIIDQQLYFDTSVIFPKVQNIFRSIFELKLTQPSEKHIADVNEAYGFVEKYLQKNGFIAADHLTVADVSIVATVSTLDTLVPVDRKYTKLHAWWDELKQEEWYQRVNPPGLAQFDNILKLAMKKNAGSA